MSDIDYDRMIEELSKPDGWIKGGAGSWMRPVGGVCMYGAACRIVGSTEVHDLFDSVCGVISEQYPERAHAPHVFWEVPAFNDHPDTTLEDVILVLEKARAHG